MHVKAVFFFHVICYVNGMTGLSIQVQSLMDPKPWSADAKKAINSFNLAVPTADFKIVEPTTEPVIRHTGKFQFPFTRDASKGIACAAAQLLLCVESLHPRLRLGYRMEFQPDNNNYWSLCVRLHALSWFDSIQDDEDRVAKARAYILRVRSNPDAQPLNLEYERKVELVDYCTWPLTCKKSPSFHHRHSSAFICYAKIPRLDGTQNYCQQWVNDELQLKLSGDDVDGLDQRWIAAARREATRMFTVFPRTHVENRSMVISDNFWFDLVRIYQNYQTQLNVDLPPVAIRINFGKWETRSSRDTYAITCHGHAHVAVAASFVAKCTESVLPGLMGRNLDEVDHQLQDAQELELARVIYAEHLQLWEILKEIRDQLRTG